MNNFVVDINICAMLIEIYISFCTYIIKLFLSNLIKTFNAINTLLTSMYNEKLFTTLLPLIAQAW